MDFESFDNGFEIPAAASLASHSTTFATIHPGERSKKKFIQRLMETYSYNQENDIQAQNNIYCIDNSLFTTIISLEIVYNSESNIIQTVTIKI